MCSICQQQQQQQPQYQQQSSISRGSGSGRDSPAAHPKSWQRQLKDHCKDMPLLLLPLLLLSCCRWCASISSFIIMQIQQNMNYVNAKCTHRYTHTDTHTIICARAHVCMSCCPGCPHAGGALNCLQSRQVRVSKALLNMSAECFVLGLSRKGLKTRIEHGKKSENTVMQQERESVKNKAA